MQRNAHREPTHQTFQPRYQAWVNNHSGDFSARCHLIRMQGRSQTRIIQLRLVNPREHEEIIIKWLLFDKLLSFGKRLWEHNLPTFHIPLPFFILVLSLYNIIYILLIYLALLPSIPIDYQLHSNCYFSVWLSNASPEPKAVPGT